MKETGELKYIFEKAARTGSQDKTSRAVEEVKILPLLEQKCQMNYRNMFWLLRDDRSLKTDIRRNKSNI